MSAFTVGTQVTRIALVSARGHAYRQVVRLLLTINTQGNGGHIGFAPMPWGPGGNTDNPINGLMDEVRLATAARPAGWVRTEYENQRNPPAFYTLGADLPTQ